MTPAAEVSVGNNGGGGHVRAVRLLRLTHMPWPEIKATGGYEMPFSLSAANPAGRPGAT
jgi:hypothetical protein